MNSILYATSSIEQHINITTTRIHFDSIEVIRGDSIALCSDSAIISKGGCYAIDTNFTMQCASEGNISISLLKNGNPINGATQSITICEIGCIVPMSISAIVNTTDSMEGISAMISGADAIIKSASIMVVQI